MCVRVIMTTQTRQRTLPIIDVPRDVQVAVHLDRSVVLQFDEAARSVHYPKFANRRYGRRLCVRESPPNDVAVFGISLLRQDQHLVARRRRAANAPTISGPRLAWEKSK